MIKENAIYDIIILAGQSNAEGSGVGPVEKEYEENERILYLTTKVSDIENEEGRTITYPDKTLTISIAQERETGNGKTGDLALTFAEEYIKNNFLADDRKLLIIRAALGGTGFQRKQWGEGCPVEVRMHEMIAYALSLNEKNRIVAFLWHQGEHDAFGGNAPDNYEQQLRNTIDSVRKKYHCREVPFIAGDFCNEWKSKNLDSCVPIVDRIRNVFSGEHDGFVETADLLSNNQKNQNGDDIHFCRESLHILGRRYFEKYKASVEIQ